MRRVILLLFILLASWVCASTLFPSWLNDALYYPLSILIWVVIFYLTFTHEEVEVPDYINPFSSADEQFDAPAGDDKFRFKTKLERIMSEDRAYLDPLLSLTALSRIVGTNRSYLSEYINDCLGTTFYEYVNSFRIAEARKILDEDVNEQLTMELVAEKCGFHSLSTFKRSFQKETGIPPGKYRKKNSINLMPPLYDPFR